MKKTMVNKNKTFSSPATIGTSDLTTSSNVAAAFSGIVGDGSTSLFPDSREKKWSSKIITIDNDNK